MSRCFGNWQSRKPKRSFASETSFESTRDEEYRQRREHWEDEFESPGQYVERKLIMLTSEMCITPTDAEIAHLNELKTRQAIDNAVHSIIDHHWGDE